MPKTSQSPSSSLFLWPVRKKVKEDCLNCSIIIRGIIGNKVANIRLYIVFLNDFDNNFSLIFTGVRALKLTDREKGLVF
jgi:hypothetical protein